MPGGRNIRYSAIALILGLGVVWSLAAAAQKTQSSYPNGGILATAVWLKTHSGEPNLLVVDVRADKDLDGRFIPGAVRMPWSLFRRDDPARGIGSLFVGTVEAQEILGRHGIGRTHTVVLYDSVANDGGATASYVFWVLDLLGHEKIMLLDRGVDGWADAGGTLAKEARTAEAVLYQAPADEIRLRRSADAAFINSRLGDPHYTIVDARSREEYLGEKPNPSLGGGMLKLGHIPTAVNVEYKLNWTDKDRKAVKPYAALQELYRGLDPETTVITYCHSARRGSFTYFVLRLMGFTDVALYEPSWYEWGNPDRFYPVETADRKLSGVGLPSPLQKASLQPARVGGDAGAKAAKGGYVSCGG